MPSSDFTGFSPATFAFLGDLASNNNREWFAANKSRYEQDVRDVALAFIRDMAPHLRKLSKHFVADDRKVGGSLMRVHRDTRFSRDKTPYKTNVGIQFRHEAGKDVHAPGFYLHIEPEQCFLGVGLWHPESSALAMIRASLVKRGAAWRRISSDSAFRKHYEPSGESLKRVPRGFDGDHEHADDLRRKDHIAIAKLTPTALRSPKALLTVAERFALAKPYMKFLASALELPF